MRLPRRAGFSILGVLLDMLVVRDRELDDFVLELFDGVCQSEFSPPAGLRALARLTSAMMNGSKTTSQLSPSDLCAKSSRSGVHPACVLRPLQVLRR